ncbi:MAG: hypothetical protein ABWU11_25390, partial [Arthrospira platensis]
IYIWGTQLEASSTPSPYTPTQATSVTRASDAVSRVLGDEFNPSEGRVGVERDVAISPSHTKPYMRLSPHTAPSLTVSLLRVQHHLFIKSCF